MMNATAGSRPRKIIGRILFILAVLVILIITLFPIVWMLVASFKTNAELLNVKKLFSFSFTIKNYVSVFVERNFMLPFKNSLIISTSAVALSLLMGLPAAYAIAREKMRIFSGIILVIRIIPIITFLVPWYLFFTKIGIAGTYTSLIICHLIMCLPLIVWIMIPAYESIPLDLEQSAWIDGCSRFGTFIRIMLPLSAPAIATSSIMAFITSWNNFMFALILCNSKTNTLPISIYQFITYTNIDWGGIMAAATVITLPIILIALFLQRYVVSGLMAGAVKG